MIAEEIYNTYLSVSRGHCNKPWRPRKDFTGFSATPDGILCKRLELFFKKFPHIYPKEFFLAPYLVYKDEEYFPLSFYTTQKAIAVFSAMNKLKQEELPDTENQIEDIKKSLKHIALTCVEKKITFEQYCNEKQGYTYTPFLDYNERRINVYVLIKLPSFENMVNSFSLQDKELYLKDVHNSIGKFKMRINTSTRAKRLIEEGFKLISKNTNNS